MAGPTIGAASFKLGADTTEFDSKLGKSEGRFKGFTDKFKSLFLANVAADFVGKALKGLTDPLEDIAKEIGQKITSTIAGLFDTVGRYTKAQVEEIQKDAARINKAFDINAAGLKKINELRKEARFLETNATQEFRDREAFIEDFIRPLQNQGEQEAAEFLLRRFDQAQDKLIGIKKAQQDVADAAKQAAEAAKAFAEHQKEALELAEKLKPIAGFAPGDVAGSQGAASALALQRQRGDGQLVAAVKEGNQLAGDANFHLEQINLQMQLLVRSGIGEGLDLDILNP